VQPWYGVLRLSVRVNTVRKRAFAALGQRSVARIELGKPADEPLAPVPSPLDAPLGLCNVLTVLCALACLWVISPQARGAVVRLWALAVPPGFGGVVAVVLLAGVFEATWINDAEWVGALALGAVLGRLRGWTLAVEVAPLGNMIRLRAAWDGTIMAVGIVAMAIVDFISAASDQPVIAPVHVAAVSAFCAGYLGCRALAVLVRLRHASSGRP
jgi:hypothetical protein